MSPSPRVLRAAPPDPEGCAAGAPDVPDHEGGSGRGGLPPLASLRSGTGACYLGHVMRGRRWHLPTALAILVPALLIGWTLTAVSAEQASPTGSPVAGDATRGAQVFGSKGCVSCHGANLEGGVGAKLNPIQKLPGVSNPLDPSYLRQTIRNGRSGDPGFSAPMPAFPPSQLSDADLNDVIAFIIAQNQQGSAGLGPVE